MGQPKTEVCSITVMFPVTSDEQALAIKTKIAELVKEIEGVRFDFRITAMPTG